MSFCVDECFAHVFSVGADATRALVVRVDERFQVFPRDSRTQMKFGRNPELVERVVERRTPLHELFETTPEFVLGRLVAACAACRVRA